jgi:hypothetical protein
VNGYRITKSSATYQDGHFSHNSFEDEIVHAHNEVEARKKMKPLRDGYSTEVSGKLFEITSQAVYSIECLGRVRRRTVYDYIKKEA